MAVAGDFPHWVRGRRVGIGSFATVDLAVPKSGVEDQLMVVKSSEFSAAGTLRNEKEILRRLGGRCPEIVRCFGDCRSSENGRDLYNLLFEYAAGGSLADYVGGKGLPEMEVRRHAKSVLRGLDFVHGCGFVHCDVKLQNLLLFSDGRVKIADFGLAKEGGGNPAEGGGFEFRGTPLYMAPEAAAGGGGGAPADVWALGCAVVEMVTGRPAWSCEVGRGAGAGALLCRIAAGEASPEIPESVSEEGRDFLSKCFVKDPNERWTARMLLGHPFVSGMGGDEDGLQLELEFPKTTPSPRCPFDFPDSEPAAEWEWSEGETTSVLERVEGLAGDPNGYPDWSDLDGWVRIR